MYILLQPDEDGNPIRWLADHNVDDLPRLMEDFGVKEWLVNPSEFDPMYWKEGQAMLLKVEIKSPKAVEKVTVWEI